MDLERWEELMTVLQTGSLTAAADKLGYTLSGISITIGWAYGKELSLMAGKFLEFVKDKLPVAY